MRSTFRILLCVAAWLMLSPLAMAEDIRAESIKPHYIAPCCEADEPCGMPDMGKVPPCVKCPALPLAALPAIAVDNAPLLLVAFERPILLTIELAADGEAFVVVPFHPPPPTLLALGTQLTC